MRKYILFLTGLILFASCEKEENLSILPLCDDEYYYYSVGSIHYFKHSLNEIWIEFKQDDVTGEMAKSLLEKYSFINTDNFSADNYYERFKAIINKDCNCTDFKNHLKELNKDSEIVSATPVFYTSENDPMSYAILLSEVITEYKEGVISEPEFINYAEGLNLELIESHYFQYFRVRKVETGFEALEIANQVYESGMVKYANANYIQNRTLH
uniref:hypothetical protein n=1 Tax=uncultured Draconibacterium sp. TaxID=1573823 RepID=UPI003217B422